MKKQNIFYLCKYILHYHIQIKTEKQLLELIKVFIKSITLKI
jgi:hypothetical protein